MRLVNSIQRIVFELKQDVLIVEVPFETLPTPKSREQQECTYPIVGAIVSRACTRRRLRIPGVLFPAAHLAFRALVCGQVDMIMRSLGLTNAKDTIVGNNSVRGVSGGERRRVTLGEMICGPQTVFLLDSVSTGLDSSTTFDIMNTLKVRCDRLFFLFEWWFLEISSFFY